MLADIERFLEHLRVERQSAPNTISAYRTDLLQFERVLSAPAGGLVVAQPLSASSVAAYADWLQGQSYTASTVARKMVAVRSFLGFMGGDLTEDWLARLRPPPAPRKPPSVLTPEQFEKLRRAPAEMHTPRGQRDTALLDLLYTTGMRASEITQLNLEHLDLEGGRIRLPGRPEYSLPLGSARGSMRSYLEHSRPHLVRQPAEAALFVNLRGKRLSRQGLWLVVKHWAHLAELDAQVSPHSLRHSMAHLWLSQGRSRREVQQALGLSSPGAIRVRSKPGK